MAGKLKPLVLLALLATSACTSGRNPVVESSELVVIQGYVEAGRQITGIAISATLALGSRDTLGPPIGNARVQMIYNDVCYVLERQVGSRGFYGTPRDPYGPWDKRSDYFDPGLVVQAGDRVKIEVMYYDKVASATTVVPPAPGNLTGSAEVIYVPADTTLTDIAENGRITLDWTGDSDHWYFVEMWNLETNPQSIWG
ncbi:MAG TPA: DUF4249 family protein, partial [Candidatus Glassbacteria bacterium]|nr:DUF4249 family protein [Candidatus Glassbacteria bacterium]